MIEIRIHGRGGQGNVVAAYLLASAAFESGRYAQAFPSFGAERRGAPVAAFVRIADRPIRRRCQVRTPAFVIVQDSNLLQLPDVVQGLQPGCGILVNSNRTETLQSAPARPRIVSVPATRLAMEYLGRPVPNTALLAAFLSLTGMLPVSALLQVLSGRFRGEVLDNNRRLVEHAATLVDAGVWQETEHATGT